MTPHTPYADNPLRRLPSVLAMPDLQRRLSRVLREMEVGEEELTALLKLDPLAAVRGLRAVGAQVFCPESELPSVPAIVKGLGQPLTKRLFRQPFTPVRHPLELQQLWRHSVATAIAAEELAERTGLMEPDVAYLVGLLHDLPDWLTWLENEQTREERAAASSMTPTEWLMHWQLPAPFVSMVLAVQIGPRPRSAEDPPDAASLVRAAELLAELAGYRHPQLHPAEDAPWFVELQKNLDQTQTLSVLRLQRRVGNALRSFGFAPEITEAEIAADKPTSLFDLGPRRLDEFVLNIFQCTKSHSYRGIVTALLAAAVRYGQFDRAFYAKWVDDGQRLVLRSKSDASSRRLYRTVLPVGDDEAAQLRDAVSSEAPRVLRTAARSEQTLLRGLSTDELLAVPINTDFRTPSFLLLDRSLTLQPISMEEDMPLASTLVMTGTLLNQNLLLRRRHQRAEKFALTDPLTRLFNRRMGIHALEQAVSRTDRDHQPLTVLMCDLDHFKQLNDTLGHAKGDAALKATAEVLRHVVRKSDTVCRYGGEEFLVVLPDTTPDDATVLAARMFTAVHQRGKELGLPLTISIGLTSYRRRDTVESILLRADRALYASKDFGRNRFSADVDGDADEPPVATGADTHGPDGRGPDQGPGPRPDPGAES